MRFCAHCWAHVLYLCLILSWISVSTSNNSRWWDPKTSHPGLNNPSHHWTLNPNRAGPYSDEHHGYCTFGTSWNRVNKSTLYYIEADPRVNVTRNYCQSCLIEENRKPSGVKPLPFFGERTGSGDTSRYNYKILLVTVDNRPLRMNDETSYIASGSVINQHYAKLMGYDYLYATVNSSDIALHLLKRYNCTLASKVHNDFANPKYGAASYHQTLKYIRASSWNKLPVLHYLAMHYGDDYDYFIYLDADVILNPSMTNITLSDLFDKWETQRSPLMNKRYIFWGNKVIRDSTFIFTTNFPWRDDFPCAGTFIFKPNDLGRKILRQWWDYDLPLKNKYDFMEQDALWYMIEVARRGENKFLINATTTTMVYEFQLPNPFIGFQEMFFNHMANYYEQRPVYVTLLLQSFKAHESASFDKALKNIRNN